MTQGRPEKIEQRKTQPLLVEEAVLFGLERMELRMMLKLLRFLQQPVFVTRLIPGCKAGYGFGTIF